MARCRNFVRAKARLSGDIEGLFFRAIRTSIFSRFPMKIGEKKVLQSEFSSRMIGNQFPRSLARKKGASWTGIWTETTEYTIYVNIHIYIYNYIYNYIYISENQWVSIWDLVSWNCSRTNQRHACLFCYAPGSETQVLWKLNEKGYAKKGGWFWTEITSQNSLKWVANGLSSWTCLNSRCVHQPIWSLWRGWYLWRANERSTATWRRGAEIGGLGHRQSGDLNSVLNPWWITGLTRKTLQCGKPSQWSFCIILYTSQLTKGIPA